MSFYGPKASPQGFVVLFSGEDGINEQDDIAITRLVDKGMLVAAINARVTLRILGQANLQQGCVDLSVPLERLSHTAQADRKFTQYYEPILLGRDAGGMLVYAALAQAPASTFAGGVSVDLSIRMKLARRLCELRTTSVGPDEQRLSPGYRLAGWWRVTGTHPLTPEVMAFAEATVGANPFSAVQIQGPKTLARLYLDAVGTPLRGVSQASAETAAGEAIPLVEVSSDASDDTLAIIFSGSSGWREIDRHLVDTLKDEGMTVLGIDSFRYFWSKRTPEGVAQDLARIITHYRTNWHVKRVVLIGYSFGANILPFAYNRMPSDVQDAIAMMALLAPQRFASFEIGLGESTTKPNPVTLVIEPEVSKVDPAKWQCIYAEQDADDSLCTTEAMKHGEVIQQFGKLLFDDAKDDDLAKFILSGIERRALADLRQ
ncbi:MAG: AcvB/VirJ family lysyl-phosphatidylglycerol hydrolase [Gammaproteobacteria bacterium]